MSGSAQSGALEAWEVRARNLPEHARNPIHTDEGARAAGFAAALVAGVTTYAYLTHPVAAAWGAAWVAHGWAEVRFLAPVLHHDLVRCRPVALPGGDVRIEAQVGDEVRATLTTRPPTPVPPPTTLPAGEPLRPVPLALAGEWHGYGARAGDDLPLYEQAGVVHPAVWPALANHVVHTQVARGSWVHTRSAVIHHGPVPDSAHVEVRAVVVSRRQRRSGEWAVLEVQVVHDGRVVVVVDHEAIVALPGH